MAAKGAKGHPVILDANGEKKRKPGTFVKGDPRINRHGRPKNHDQLRALIQRIAGEAVDGKPEWSQIELMLRAMMKSKQAQDRKEIIEHGWGKVPQQLDINVKDVDNAIERELARLAGRSQAEDAAASSGEADTGEVDGDSTTSA